MTFRLIVTFRDHTGHGPIEWEGVTGWAIDDPPGWVQIVTEEDVVFVPSGVLESVIVPNLARTGDVNGEVL